TDFGINLNSFDSGSLKLGRINSHSNDIRITSTGVFIIGNDGHTISLGDPFESENGTVLSIDDYAQEITLQNTGVTSIGDSAGNGNSTLITVNDGLEIINLSNSVSSINMDNDE